MVPRQQLVDGVTRKGILLAGGSGTRLHPLTKVLSKQLLPVYNQPLVYYALWTLRACGVTEILVITRPQDAALYHNLLEDGSAYGCCLKYATQAAPRGLPEALTIAEAFLDGHPLVLALGDNLLYGPHLTCQLIELSRFPQAVILGYPMADPRAYGVVEVAPFRYGHAVSLEEKPTQPKSNLAIPGLYFYPNEAVEVAKGLVPSERGELEIVDVSRHFMEQDRLYVHQLSPGVAWFDCGTFDSLKEATEFVAAITRRQGLRVCDPTEFALATA